MRIFGIEWPGDLVADEERHKAGVEERLERELRHLDPEDLTELLRDEERIYSLTNAVEGPAFRGKLSLAIRFESAARNGVRRMGCVVRVRWHRIEVERRQSAAQRAERERILSTVGQRIPRYVPITGNEPRGGELERAGVQTLAVQASTYSAGLTVSRAELAEMRRDDLDLMSAKVAEVERAIALGLERQANEMIANVTRAVMPDTAAGADLDAIARANEADPRDRFNVHTIDSRVDDYGGVGNVIQQYVTVRGVSGELRRYQIDPSSPELVIGDIVELTPRGTITKANTSGRRNVEITYRPTEPAPANTRSIRFPPRELEERRRLAVEWILRATFAIAVAAERCRDGVELFYGALYGALRAWSKNPSPIELDIEHAPFGVDVTPAADPTAERFALLELK